MGNSISVFWRLLTILILISCTLTTNCFAETTVPAANNFNHFNHFNHFNQNSLAPMLKTVMPSIVSISAIKKVKQQEDQQQIALLLASGVIVDASKGYILTNSHVVTDLDEIRITLSDQRKFDATLLGQDPDSDLALLKIDADNLTQIKFADSDKSEVGDFVVAIGSPYGFNHTVTSGIISAIGRTDIGLEGYYDFIQTDAAINIGNSGGGLLNLQGELIGINTAIISPSSNSGSIGLGLAIPSNMAQGILNQLADSGKVFRGPLGVRVQNLTSELAQAFSTKTIHGAVIIEIIDNSPAQSADLQIGDVLLAINDKEIKDSVHLRTLVSLIPIGNKALIKLSRNGKNINKHITITDPKDKFTKGSTIFSGLTGYAFEEDLDPQIPGTGTGIRVSEVEKHSLKYSELQEDDIIVSANQHKTPTIAALKKAASTKSDILLLQILRDKIMFFVAIKGRS